MDSRTLLAVDRLACALLVGLLSGCFRPAPDPHVERVTAYWTPDGDTIHVDLADGSHDKVRLIGVDAPEDSSELIECGGPESTTAMRGLAPRGTELALIADPAEDDRDRFGRLLRYVELPDGRDIGEEQIRAGHAEAHRYGDLEFDRYDRYRAAQDAARAARRGVWGECP